MSKEAKTHTTPESQLNATAKILQARKEYLFKEITRIHDIVSKADFSDDIEADIQLSVLDKEEATLGELVREILTFNAMAEKGDKFNTKDLTTFRTLVDAIRKCCLKCKISAEKRTIKEQQPDNVRLRKMELPTFSGNIGEWQTFIEQYNVTVHSKSKFSGVEKLTLLRSVLKNEPLSIVTQYKLKDESYMLAYQALVDRYSNPRMLSRYYLNQILGYKPVPTHSGKQTMRFMEIHKAATSSLLKLDISDLADYLLFELVYRNLPQHQQKRFDLEVNPSELPNLVQLFEFVDKFAKSEELHSDPSSSPTPMISKPNFRNKNQQVLLGLSKKQHCPHCKQGHPLFRCKSFAHLPLLEKLQIVKDTGACKQCLGTHKGTCTSKYSCRNCKAKNHHSFLCNRPNVAESSQGKQALIQTIENAETIPPRSCNACLANQQTTVLLGTIKAYIPDIWGTLHETRVVCDPGSHVNIVTQALVQKLGLKRTHSPVDVEGVNQDTSRVLGSVKLEMRGFQNKEISYKLDALILPTICSDLPSEPVTTDLPEALRNLPLADPDYHTKKPVDILLGADDCMEILSTPNTVIKGKPTAIRTIFGYVLTGRTALTENIRKVTLCTTTSLDKILKSFWEVEQIEGSTKPMDDVKCEEHFRNTVQRDSTGRYIVRLPFKEYATPLQGNMKTGLKSFERLENRFKKIPGLQASYTAVIEDYLRQGHMSLAENDSEYVLPHHCVYKDSTSTAIRVVFDASSPDVTGISLNSRLKVGPKLQNDLPQLLITFRFHEVALQADIRQMFRNITLHPDDRRYQQLLWRFAPNEPMRHYQLNTVIFGFTSSPYLEQRVLKQLEQDEGEPCPEASKAVLHHTFNNDILPPEQCPEIKPTTKAQILAVQSIENTGVLAYIDKVSSFSKLQRVVGFILRFISNLRNKENHYFEPLTAIELKTAMLTCVKLTQHKYFFNEINALKRGGERLKNLQNLNPFLDRRQLLRAGGRIRRAESLVEDARHPLILPKNCHLSALICDFYHRKLLHAGPRAMQAVIQQQFWILSLRQLIKKRLRLCLRCYKLSASPTQPQMGELPHHRVNISRPFTNICIDFGGPFTTKESRLRSSIKHKSYLCIFVCMSVKAVHIEAVSDLSTSAFLAALTRFTSRRGLPQNIYSDCGRNFVGAAREIKNVQTSIVDSSKIIELAAEQGIHWHLSPPYGPNFNGLAEAAIKSAKRHLSRQIGEEILTFEEFVTLLCRIEAVLNSRPLTPISADPNEDVVFLSPAHFLIGDQMLVVPEAPIENISLKERWHRVQVKSQTFWKQWSREYLHTLLQRQRWTKRGTNLTVGQIVFLAGENLPPLQWPIGKIVALHEGEDKVARVATVRIKNKELKRPVSKLLTLPEGE